MSLDGALNRRKTGQQNVVPMPTKDDLMIVAVEPPPVPKPPDPTLGTPLRPLRDLRPGEIGTQTEIAYPDTPYSIEATRVLLTRLSKGCAYLLENLENEEGMEQLGYFIDLMDSTGAMLTGHMAMGILTKD